MRKFLLGIIAAIVAVAWALTPQAEPVTDTLSINDIKTLGTKTYAVETSPDRVHFVEKSDLLARTYFVEKVDALFAANLANVKF